MNIPTALEEYRRSDLLQLIQSVDKDRAMNALNQSLATDQSGLVWVAVDPHPKISKIQVIHGLPVEVVNKRKFRVRSTDLMGRMVPIDIFVALARLIDYNRHWMFRA